MASCPTGGTLDLEPVYQSESFPESPAIHVAVLPGVDPVAYRWVRVGAEEEGIPCREVPPGLRSEAAAPGESRGLGGEDLVAAAYAAAQESRLGVGIAVGRGRVTLHEAHMPAGCPVWEFPIAGELRQACRLAGCNAGRMVKRMPLRFEQVSAPYESEEISRAGAEVTLGLGRAAPSEMTAPALVGKETQADAADMAAIVVGIVRALQERGIV